MNPRRSDAFAPIPTDDVRQDDEDLGTLAHPWGCPGHIEDLFPCERNRTLGGGSVSDGLHTTAIGGQSRSLPVPSLRP
jgi:hypothetical protein